MSPTHILLGPYCAFKVAVSTFSRLDQINAVAFRAAMLGFFCTSFFLCRETCNLNQHLQNMLGTYQRVSQFNFLQCPNAISALHWLIRWYPAYRLIVWWWSLLSWRSLSVLLVRSHVIHVGHYTSVHRLHWQSGKLDGRFGVMVVCFRCWGLRMSFAIHLTPWFAGMKNEDSGMKIQNSSFLQSRPHAIYTERQVDSQQQYRCLLTSSTSLDCLSDSYYYCLAIFSKATYSCKQTKQRCRRQGGGEGAHAPPPKKKSGKK